MRSSLRGQYTVWGIVKCITIYSHNTTGKYMGKINANTSTINRNNRMNYVTSVPARRTRMDETLQRLIACSELPQSWRAQVCQKLCKCSGRCAPRKSCCQCGIPGHPCTKCGSQMCNKEPFRTWRQMQKAALQCKVITDAQLHL